MMQNPSPTPPRENLGKVLSDEMNKMVIGFIRRPQQKEKKPSRWGIVLVWFAYNGVFSVIELISAVTVGAMTNFLYGILVFLAGFFPMLVNEGLFMWAYASKWQKIIAAVGAVIGIVSTIGIGILAGGINAISYFNIANAENLKSILEGVMLVSIVLTAGFHGCAWIAYFFIDAGIHAFQRSTQAEADYDMKEKNLTLAERQVTRALALADRINAHMKENKGGVLNAAFSNIAGEELLPEETISRKNGNPP